MRGKMDFDKRVDTFCLKVKRLQIDGALVSAKRTLELMRELITTQKHGDHWALIDHVKAVGTKMVCAKPRELAVGNMVRRVLHLIREVAASEGVLKPDTQELEDTFRPQFARPVSLLTLLDQAPDEQQHGGNTPAAAIGHSVPQTIYEADGDDESQGDTLADLDPSHSGSRKKRARQWSGKPQVIELLNELIEEMDLAEDAITERATEYIHANEVILTFGLSQTTLKFLIKASERRSFQVVVAEGAPELRGLTMAQHLLDAGIPTSVIPDSSIFAMMARVNKVLVGSQAVLATGGVLAQSGTRLVALAAEHYRVPFVVITGLYKLSPLFPHDPQMMFNDFHSPSVFTDQRLTSSTLHVGKDDQYAEVRLQLPCPSVDYVEPEAIALLITDTGGYTPSYIYRLLSEYYSREDYILSKGLLNKMTGH